MLSEYVFEVFVVCLLSLCGAWISENSLRPLVLLRETILYADEVLRNTVHALNQDRAYFPFVNVFLLCWALKSQSVERKRNRCKREMFFMLRLR